VTNDRWAAADKTDDPSIEARRAARYALEDAYDTTAGLRDPFRMADEFIRALQDGPASSDAQNTLDAIVTPESRQSWGDFSDARALLGSIEQWGLTAYAEPADGAADVVYVGVVRGVQSAFGFNSEQIIFMAAAVTLVWRHEYGYWMVHHFGDKIRPEDVPRSVE
jgi:hypothetical protein